MNLIFVAVVSVILATGVFKTEPKISDENKKTEKAAALNIPVISVSEFKSKFNIH